MQREAASINQVSPQGGIRQHIIATEKDRRLPRRRENWKKVSAQT
jgi:hypothetical protein